MHEKNKNFISRCRYRYNFEKYRDFSVRSCRLLLISVLQISNPGTNEERTVLEKAEGFGCHREKSRPPEADVDVVLPTLEVAIGNDFELSPEFINRSDQRRVVEAYISGNVVYYTGVSSTEFLLRDPTVTMEPNESGRSLSSFLFIRSQSIIVNAAFSLFGGVKETVVVEAKRYMKHLVEQANLHFIVTGKIKETGQIITAMKVVTLHNPKLSVKVGPRPFHSPPCICFFHCVVFTWAVTSGVWLEQSERRDDDDRGVHQPLLLRPGGGLHPHGRSRSPVAQIQILQVSCRAMVNTHREDFRT